MPSAYLLVSHGSRDPRPQVAMEQLAALISQRQHSQIPAATTLSRVIHTSYTTAQLAALSTREPLIGTACLELSPVPLHEQIKEFGVMLAVDTTVSR